MYQQKKQRTPTAPHDHRLTVLFFMTSLVSTSGKRDEWCGASEDHDHDEHEHDHDEHEHDHDERELPHAEEFLHKIFSLYGNNKTCTIPIEKFEQLMEDLGLSHHEHSEGDVHTEDGHDHTDGHSHAEEGHNHAKENGTNHKSLNHTIRKRHADDNTAHTASDCFDIHDLVDIFSINKKIGLTQANFTDVSPALIHQIAIGCKQTETEPTSPSAGEVWGYSLLSAFLVSINASVGLVIARWRESSGYKYLLTLMLSMAVGTLLADALMHLIPESLGVHQHDHSHSEDESSHVIEMFVWKAFLACLAVLGFFDLQLLLLPLHKLHSVSKMESVMSQEKHEDNGKKTQDPEIFHYAPESLGWMISIGDALHNTADGLAIAAAYSHTWQFGLVTTIAVFCHELPHELGDVAAMLSVGWHWKKILVLQSVSQSFAFLGVFIGVPVSENQSVRDWIFILTAGMFLYIALSDLVPELLEYYKTYNKVKIFLLTNAGILSGYFIMTLISLLEEKLSL